MDSRRIGFALDFSASSKYALDWALKNSVREKDHLILLVVLERTNENAHKADLWQGEGSPLIPFVEFREAKTLQNYGVKQDPEVFDMLDTISRQKELVIVAKLYWGDARAKLIEAVSQLDLTCLVMGSRGLGTIKGVLLGSVSSYVIANCSCPITVVKLPHQH